MKLFALAAFFLLLPVFCSQHTVTKHAHHTKRLLLFSEKSSASLYVLDMKTKLHYQLALTKQVNPIAVAYDSATGTVFWSIVASPHSYIKSALADGNNERVLRPKSSTTSKTEDSPPTVVDGLAFDPVDRRVYYTDTGPHAICSMDVNGDQHRVLVNSGLDQPRSIVLDPKSRKMYWTDWGSRPHIARADMDDGSGVEWLIQDNVTMAWPNALAVDSSTNEMFWCDGKLGTIEKASLTGRSRRLLDQSFGAHYFGLTIDKDYVYVTNWNYGGIARLPRSGGEVVAFGPTFRDVTMNALLYIEDNEYFADAYIDANEDEDDDEDDDEKAEDAANKYKYATNSKEAGSKRTSKETKTIKTPIAFCAQRVTSLKPADIIKFDSVPTNDGLGFNVNTSIFTPPVKGIYWLQVTVGLHTQTPADVRLHSTALTTTPSVIRVKKNDASEDTVTGVEMLRVTAEDDTSAVWLSTISQLTANLPTPVEFCGFQLDNVMNTLAAFSIERRVIMSPYMQKTEDIIAFDTHGGWRFNINRYSVPETGVWVISSKCVATKTAAAYYRLYASMYVSEEYSSDFLHTNENNIETRTTVARVAKDEFIFLKLYLPILGSVEYKTFLSAFLYNPKMSQPISWCLSLTRPLNKTVDSVDFDHVLHEEGDGWNENTGTYTVPASGVYYIYIQAGIRANGYTNIRMELLINDKVAAAVISIGAAITTDESYKLTRARATITRLTIGDVLRVRLPAGHQLFADNTNHFTTFCGFRLYV